MVPEHPGTLHVPDSSPEKCLRNQQVRYLPLPMRACTVAFFTSYWEFPQEVQMGDGRVRDMWEARKRCSDRSLAACDLRCSAQYVVMRDLLADFHSFLDGGLARM